MDEGSNVFIFIGVVILSFSIGHMYETVDGWIFFGCGLILLGAINGTLHYLGKKNGSRK